MDLTKCPYCPTGGNVSLACTDLENESEYQVWCRACWAHGPTRVTVEAAVMDWNEVSVAAHGMELTPGKTYVLDRGYGGLQAGRRIVFRWRSEDGRFNVFNPEGEADIQSAFSIRTIETVRYIRR